METEQDVQRVQFLQDFKREFFGFDEINQEQLDNIINRAGTPENVQVIYCAIMNIIPQIKNLGFNVDIVPLLQSEDGFFWSDYADTYLRTKHLGTFFDKDFIYFTIYLDNSGEIITKKNISINYSELTKEQKCDLLSLFYKWVPNNFDWNGDNNNIMTIKYDTIENPTRLDFDSLRTDDTYPLLYIPIYFNTISGYGLFDYIESNNIISEIEHILPNNKVVCSFGNFDIEIKVSKVDDEEVKIVHEALKTILSQVKRKRKADFGVTECRLYHYESGNKTKMKYIINCDPMIKDRFFDFEKYL
jgi:hypothetical protein